uniref:Retrovirus-related Pol polyprotein from transposon TNT 1-94 n=1 Tax=Nelumbo nucifera TaxID=4432 RepID=A0A822ZA28_NELNU|nr:TPA_asm: hypothetical protein HUJ06_001374 [Nelumbo nucifera]
MTMMGKGNIKLKMNELNHIVTEVFYVPELKNNLLSIGQLQEKGLAILIQHGKCKVYHPEKGLIIQAEMSANRMFTLLVASQPKKPTCFHTATQDLSHLWHYRYEHLSHKGLRTLQNKKMVNGLPQFEASKTVCTDCMVGKQHRDPIPKKSTWRASLKLQLIHANICGPITPISNSKESPTLAVKNITPEEAWSGVKPSIEHFRVFGCISHVHVPDVKRTKEDKSFTCVLLGVSEESKAYRLNDPIAKKIVISRDVVFEEEKYWDWDKCYEEQVVAVLEWGDNEENAVVNNEDEAEIEDGSSVEEIAVDSSNLVEEESSPSSIEGRVRRPPGWMRDYETGEGLSEEEDETNLALFASADPLYFEEAVKKQSGELLWILK